MLPVRGGRTHRKNGKSVGMGNDGRGGASGNAMADTEHRTPQITIIKQLQPNRTPQMLGNQRGARLHIAPGAYPVYYAIARANGLFKGQSIRSFKSKSSVSKTI